MKMIGRLSGLLLEKNPPQLLVDCGGVGYQVSVPMSTFYVLPKLGEKITLLTHLIIRADTHILYGFSTDRERSSFKLLIKVKSIGTCTALSILSGMSTQDLALAITTQKISYFTSVPGIGKKTAERILLELKGKLDTEIGFTDDEYHSDIENDILNALTSLGYSDKQATLALKQLPNNSSVTNGIRLSLKFLSKS